MADGMPVAGTLVDAMTKDFYKFTGKKGDRIVATANAQSLAQTTGDDSTVVDTFVTLYDANKKVIAQDDDPWPRFGRDAEVLTVLPADGDYYITVGDCNAEIPMGCADPAMLLTFDYQLSLFPVSSLGSPVPVIEKEPNDDTNAATLVPYMVPAMGMKGQYGLDLLAGDLAAAGDVDVYKLVIPADTVVSAGQRGHAELWLTPPGTANGDGSTSPVKLWVTDSTGTTKIAEVDQANYHDGDNATSGPAHVTLPIDPLAANPTYFVFVQHSGAAGARDFYFLKHTIGTFYYGTEELETKNAAKNSNDTVANAETVAIPMGVMSTTYFVDGDLDDQADVDLFKLDSAGKTKANLFCESQREGSNVRKLTASLVKADGTTLVAANATLTEAADVDAYVSAAGGAITLPAGVVYLRVEAKAAPDATVTGKYYHCTVDFQ
jgi:hypothetical protein